VLAHAQPEPITEIEKVLFIDALQHPNDHLLDDFVLQSSDADRTLSSVSFGDVNSLRQLGSIGCTLDARVKIGDAIFSSGCSRDVMRTPVSPSDLPRFRFGVRGGLDGLAFPLVRSNFSAGSADASAASVIASSIGAIVACYFAGASAEVLPPETNRWMLQGGVYGAAFGLPVALILGPLGLFEVWPRMTESNHRPTSNKSKTNEEDTSKRNA
jgi:hypothetical protein